MRQYIESLNQSIDFQKDRETQAFTVRHLDFINELDATLYIPMLYGALPPATEVYLTALHQSYHRLRSESFAAIGQKAFEDKRWGKKLSENPQLDLVWVKVLTDKSAYQFELAYNDSEHDVYGLWVTTFESQTLTDIRREAW